MRVTKKFLFEILGDGLQDFWSNLFHTPLGFVEKKKFELPDLFYVHFGNNSIFYTFSEDGEPFLENSWEEDNYSSIFSFWRAIYIFTG